MSRGRRYATALVMLGAMSLATAQETADIMLGGEVVARVRDQGTYQSVQHRAAAVDEQINQILAETDDPGALEVSLERIDGMWAIVLGGRSVMSVYPAEAAANGMTPEMLGSIWVRQFRDALPEAAVVQVTEIGETTMPPAPTEPVVPRDPVTIMEEPVTGSPTVPDVPRAPREEVLEVPATPPTERDEIVAGQGARLVILEAFNRARDLPEDDYLVRREAMADRLFDELVQVITEGSATGRIVATPTPAPPAPPIGVAEPETAAPPAPPAVDEPVTTGVMAQLQLSDEGRQRILDRIPADDPSYANVVQKVVIRAKFQAASEAYRTALETDPTAAAQAREVLGAARKANTAEDFDTAERYLDTGLQILGVTEWEQNIGAAMSDFGIQ